MWNADRKRRGLVLRCYCCVLKNEKKESVDMKPHMFGLFNDCHIIL